VTEEPLDPELEQLEYGDMQAIDASFVDGFFSRS
jgi:hypothetical protein